jgi:hypothetical protein
MRAKRSEIHNFDGAFNSGFEVFYPVQILQLERYEGWREWLFFFLKHSTNVDTHICMSIHLYEHMHVYHIFMSTFERLNQFNFEIHEVSHQKYLAVDMTSFFTERIISRKYNTHIKSE